MIYIGYLMKHRKHQGTGICRVSILYLKRHTSIVLMAIMLHISISTSCGLCCWKKCKGFVPQRHRFYSDVFNGSFTGLITRSLLIIKTEPHLSQVATVGALINTINAQLVKIVFSHSCKYLWKRSVCKIW